VTERPVDAEDLLARRGDGGEIRWLTMFFADLVGSTALSTQVEPETYHLVVGRYRDQVLRIVNDYGGHIGSTKGDGLMAVFGHPITREGDVRRAIQAGLELTRDVSRLSDQSKRQFGFGVDVRVGVHCGQAYVDTSQVDFSGLVANVATQISGHAPPGAVVVSDAVECLVRNDFQFETRPLVTVKGPVESIVHYRVVSENRRII
jgi:class 3 adenylate cyclase